MDIARGTISAPAIGQGHNQPSSLLRRADQLYYFGCLLCGTWILGPIGAPILLYGIYLMRKVQFSGESIRPWSITMVGGLILVDSSVNWLAWGLDLLPSHHTTLGRSLWIDYGMFGDGGYMFDYNSTWMNGVSNAGEKSVQIAAVVLVMPIRAAAAWGLLHMKRWGLQWSIIGNWMYVALWVMYAANMSQEFSLRFGSSEFGVLGFWLIGGLPFLGPLVLLPYLHTVNHKLWSED